MILIVTAFKLLSIYYFFWYYFLDNFDFYEVLSIDIQDRSSVNIVELSDAILTVNFQNSRSSGPYCPLGPTSHLLFLKRSDVTFSLYFEQGFFFTYQTRERTINCGSDSGARSIQQVSLCGITVKRFTSYHLLKWLLKDSTNWLCSYMVQRPI